MNVKEFSVIATLSADERRMIVDELVEALLPHLGLLSSPVITKEEEPPISKKEACYLLRCSEPTMTKWMAEGKIPFYRKGRRVYFFKSEVLKSLEQPLKRA